MKKLHGDSRLYNILFPIWLFYLIPTGIWLIIFPANFIIDSLVLYIAIKHYAANGFADVWRKSILRIWGIGFICDLAGALLILAIEFLRGYMLPAINTFYFPGATIIAIPGVLLSGVLIYRLNRRYAFKKCNIEMGLVQKLSLALSLFTAPYAMLIPLYG
ncbi:hypothetical protein [Selenomonas sp. AB3002]|uniref:hypothetical protein n=1 Tax=Selenomonas sp. AB3002 TaxID=1392502 RepID=UPI0004970B86